MRRAAPCVRADLIMGFVPHTDEDRAKMLAAVGAGSLEALFEDIPERLRFPELSLPPAMSELEVERELSALAARNRVVPARACFLGAGTYHHFVPATVDYVLQRGEMYTAYTPYQPELSQGMLQAMFEYQSMICRLTGMEVSNASHYDGATSLAEAALLALGATSRERDAILISPRVHPRYRQVVRTYLGGHEARVLGDEAGDARVPQLVERLDDTSAALVVQYPDFLGQLEDLRGLGEAVHAAGALLIVVVDPLALGMLRPPGEHGADVVVGSGQTLGIAPGFGGPHLGIFATRMQHVRRLSGRLVGQTVDAAGERGYVLTLGTREQHIRREKATSNICTNAGLMALASAVYMATLGKRGLRHVAGLCHRAARYAASRLQALPGVEVHPQAPELPYFRELVVKLPGSVANVNRELMDRHGIQGGLDLGESYPELSGHALLAFSELHDRAAVDAMVDALVDALERVPGAGARRRE
jgi:glycine dehydrogenase subunit 1